MSRDDSSFYKANVWASGPILKDRLFFMAMYELRDSHSQDLDTSVAFNTQSKNDFWGLKLDWHLNENHLIELLAFSDLGDSTTKTSAYNFGTDTFGADTGEATTGSGGDNWSLTYTGHFSDNFTAKALYGVNERRAIGSSPWDADCSIVAALRGSESWQGRLPPDQRPRQQPLGRARGVTSGFRVDPGRPPPAFRLGPGDHEFRQPDLQPGRRLGLYRAGLCGGRRARQRYPGAPGHHRHRRRAALPQRCADRDRGPGLLHRGQLERHARPAAANRRARGHVPQQARLGRDLHQGRLQRHDLPAPGLQLGREGRRHHQAVRQRGPLLPATHQQAGRLLRRRVDG